MSRSDTALALNGAREHFTRVLSVYNTTNYLLTYLLTYFITSLLTYLLIYFLPSLLTFSLPSLLSYLLAYLHTYLLTYLSGKQRRIAAYVPQLFNFPGLFKVNNFRANRKTVCDFLFLSSSSLALFCTVFDIIAF